MKKQLWLMVLGMLVAFSSCNEKPKDGRTDTYNSGKISITADASFAPIIQEEIDVFEGLNPLAEVVPIYTTEVEAISLLLKDSVRLAVATRIYTPAELESFKIRKFQPEWIKIATDGLALITNRQNPDTLISVQDIRRLLTGEIDTWKQLYPNSKLGEIQVVFDNQNSSTVRFAIDSICQGRPLSTKNVKALKTNQEVIDFVAKAPDAIGVIGVNWLGNRSDTTNLSFRNEITIMSVSAKHPAKLIDSWKPYQAYLFDGRYPLSRPIYVLLNDPRMGLSRGFSSFLQGERGQRIILKSGLVPATQPVYIRNVSIKDE